MHEQNVNKPGNLFSRQTRRASWKIGLLADSLSLSLCRRRRHKRRTNIGNIVRDSNFERSLGQLALASAALSQLFDGVRCMNGRVPVDALALLKHADRVFKPTTLFDRCVDQRYVVQHYVAHNM